MALEGGQVLRTHAVQAVDTNLGQPGNEVVVAASVTTPSPGPP